MKTIKRYLEFNQKIDSLKSELSHAEWVFKQLNNELQVGVTRSGSSGDSECWTQWWVFPATKTNDEIVKAMEHMGVGNGHYSGAGQSFSHDYSILRKGSRVLVEQCGGLDV